MNTLIMEFEKLLENKNDWSYYNDAPDLTMEILYSPEESLDFIKNYFRCGKKEKLFDDIDIVNYEILKTRAQHILSTYLLGIIIAKSLKIQRKENNKDFMYLWFLACLYHDIGYYFEKNGSCEDLKKVQTKGIEGIKEVCKIKYLYDGKFSPYKREHINLYLSERAKYRDGRTGVIDHGIIGGFLLYDRLRKNFDSAKKKVENINSDVHEESFEYNGRYFSINHYKDYKIAAQAIIIHNIWIDTLRQYMGENKETIDNIEKINKNNQIAYILAIADTLEPIKKCGIDSLSSAYYNNMLDGFTYYFNGCKKYDEMIKSVKELNNWVDVTIEESEGGFIIKL